MGQSKKRSAKTIIAEAARENTPVIRTICLTSGGGDSTVLAHQCRDLYDELFHIDTGTALPGVRSFVEDFADFIEKPLRVVEGKDAYRQLVLGDDEWWDIYDESKKPGQSPEDFRRECMEVLETKKERMDMLMHRAPMGFPGPAGHRFAYQALKEPQLLTGLRDIKVEFGDGSQKQRVLLLSGVRMDESQRRKMAGAAQGYWERKGNQVWVNPLLDWKNQEMAEYRRDHKLPVSDVTALTHRSGECNCLAFATKGEPAFIRQMYPDWYAEYVEPLEKAAFEKGLEHWQWGWGAGEPPVGGVGPLCQGCEIIGRP